MNKKVTLRELTRTDLPALEDVIRKTWNYDSTGNMHCGVLLVLGKK